MDGWTSCEGKKQLNKVNNELSMNNWLKQEGGLLSESRLKVVPLLLTGAIISNN
jgi:hypothetical protein